MLDRLTAWSEREGGEVRRREKGEGGGGEVRRREKGEGETHSYSRLGGGGGGGGEGQTGSGRNQFSSLLVLINTHPQ